MSEEAQKFEGHYVDWRRKRVDAIVDYYGRKFFKDRTILELGAGYGDLGAEFIKYGSLVTTTDARMAYVEEALDRYPPLNGCVYDLDAPWPFTSYKKFDMILHLGVLYHQQADRVEASLKELCSHCNYLVLETEVVDSHDPAYIVRQEESFGWDQSYHGWGCRPSPAYVERVLDEAGFTSDMVKDDRCNSDFHCYNWAIHFDNTYGDGKRRFWFCKRKTL